MRAYAAGRTLGDTSAVTPLADGYGEEMTRLMVVFFTLLVVVVAIVAYLIFRRWRKCRFGY